MSEMVVGTCGLCGGPVTVPGVWLGIIPPSKVCQKCGAVAAENHGPVLPMVPVQHITKTTTTTNIVIKENDDV